MMVHALHEVLGYLESLAALNVQFRQFKRPFQWHLSQLGHSKTNKHKQ